MIYTVYGTDIRRVSANERDSREQRERERGRGLGSASQLVVWYGMSWGFEMAFFFLVFFHDRLRLGRRGHPPVRVCMQWRSNLSVSSSSMPVHPSTGES